jgi:hypothetical protein
VAAFWDFVLRTEYAVLLHRWVLLCYSDKQCMLLSWTLKKTLNVRSDKYDAGYPCLTSHEKMNCKEKPSPPETKIP